MNAWNEKLIERNLIRMTNESEIEWDKCYMGYETVINGKCVEVWSMSGRAMVDKTCIANVPRLRDILVDRHTRQKKAIDDVARENYCREIFGDQIEVKKEPIFVRETVEQKPSLLKRVVDKLRRWT